MHRPASMLTLLGSGAFRLLMGFRICLPCDLNTCISSSLKPAYLSPLCNSARPSVARAIRVRMGILVEARH
eukprot:scaffold7352_cov254-Pinguiococcus_pyrenoidosus.AAC.13